MIADEEAAKIKKTAAGKVDVLNETVTSSNSDEHRKVGR